MPSRQISSQSFDEILSDLGDDPAIPDPHGIRKNLTPPNPHSSPPIKSKRGPLTQLPDQLYAKNGWIVIALGVLMAAFCLGLFFIYQSHQADSQASLEGLQNQITILKKELVAAQENWETDQDELYDVLDELEVSIHSKSISDPVTKTIKTAVHLPFEADLLRWRYLGVTRIGAIEQAFFYSGKGTVMFKKEDLILGEWRLSQAQKEAAILTHPKGKSITLKSSKTE